MLDVEHLLQQLYQYTKLPIPNALLQQPFANKQLRLLSFVAKYGSTEQRFHALQLLAESADPTCIPDLLHIAVYDNPALSKLALHTAKTLDPDNKYKLRIDKVEQLLFDRFDRQLKGDKQVKFTFAGVRLNRQIMPHLAEAKKVIRKGKYL